MDIQKAMKDYQIHFDEYYRQFGSKAPKNQKKLERPNFLNEVILPILNTLPEAMPGYNFAPPPADYTMYGEYYRVKGGIILYGGFSISDNFELLFTPYSMDNHLEKPLKSVHSLNLWKSFGISTSNVKNKNKNIPEKMGMLKMNKIK